MKTPWLAGFTVLVLTLSARASETHWTPLQLSIGPGEIALVDADTEVKGLRLGLFADNARVDGLDLCLAAGESRDGGSGLAFATFYANCGGDFLGIQLSPMYASAFALDGIQAGGWCRTEERLRGLQLGGMAMAGEVKGLQLGAVCVAGEVTGLQIGIACGARDLDGLGIALLSGGSVNGVQISGLAWAESVEGCLIAAVAKIDRLDGVTIDWGSNARYVRGWQIGVFNEATEDLSGVQIGLLNITHHLQGLQIGVLNFSGEGGLPVSPLLNWAW